MDDIWQRYLETLPDLSIRKSRIHRSGVAGFSNDAFRAFAHHMRHGAHQLARLRYAQHLGEALDLAAKQSRKAADPVRAGPVVNEMRKRHDFAMSPKDAPWAQVISSMAFVYHLGMSPAAALVNLSQTAILGTPILAAAHGKNGLPLAARELSRALVDFTKGRGAKLTDQWTVRNNPRLSADEKAAIEEGYRRATIDSSQAHDLAGVSEQGVRYSDVRAKWTGFFSAFFHHAERLNREVTYLAAYGWPACASLSTARRSRAPPT